MSLVSKRNGWRVDEPLANTTDMTWVHLLMDKPYHDKLNWQRNRIRPSKFYILQDHLLPKRWTGRSDQKLLNFLYLAPPGELFFYYVTSERLSEGGGGRKMKRGCGLDKYWRRTACAYEFTQHILPYQFLLNKMPNPVREYLLVEKSNLM